MTIDLGLLMAVIGGVVIAGAVFFIVGRRTERRGAEIAGRSVAQQAERILTEAKRDADAARAQSVLGAKEEIMKAREAWEEEAQRRRQDVLRHEQRVEERETLVDRKLNALDERDKDLKRRETGLADRDKALTKRDEEVNRIVGEHRARLEQLAGLSAMEAKEQLKQAVADEARAEASALVRDIKEEAKKNGDREAKKIVAMAIQRIAAETTAETTVSSVTLPNDEMKGRIIGREGRNIRAFETATGVDVIIDDTPDTVIISCFDPIRRETARQALELLISDGRIHPGRIEEVVTKVRAQLEQELVQAGEQAAYELGIHGLHAELIKLVGRMKYRTSYGQNIYYHSKEVA